MALGKKIGLIFPSPVWSPGDSIILNGLLTLMPRLRDCELVYTGRAADSDLAEFFSSGVLDEFSTCDYIIKPGTPSWMREVDRAVWARCVAEGKRLSLLGIGTGLGYREQFRYGRKEVVALGRSGLLDVVICRDQHCYYHLRQLGWPEEIMEVLPCPALFLFPAGPPITSKTRVALDIVNIEECSHTTNRTFQDYYEKMRYLLGKLRERGSQVTLGYHQRSHAHLSRLRELFPGEEISWFPSLESFRDYYCSKDVYIGARVHGVLPCAGRGMPCFGLGTDERQSAWEQVPFISSLDIRFNGEWNPDAILDWYDSLDPAGISLSLLNYRVRKEQRWTELVSRLPI